LEALEDIESKLGKMDEKERQEIDRKLKALGEEVKSHYMERERVLEFYKTGQADKIKKARGERVAEYHKMVYEKTFEGLAGVEEREQGKREEKDYSEDIVAMRREIREVKQLVNEGRTERKEGDYSEALIGIGEGLKAMGQGMKALEGIEQGVRQGLEHGFEKIREAVSEIKVNVSGASVERSVQDSGSSGEKEKVVWDPEETERRIAEGGRGSITLRPED